MESLKYRDLVGRDMAFAEAQNYRTLRRQGLAVCKTHQCSVQEIPLALRAVLSLFTRNFDPTLSGRHEYSRIDLERVGKLAGALFPDGALVAIHFRDVPPSDSLCGG
ncbi:MAG: hypothetical protein Q7J24_07760 [Desulfomicrobium sp.]|nr:hypothetical protein [Desulfomicrobium sp.]